MMLTSRFLPYPAMAIYPFILLNRDELRHDAALIHHERIHHRQQLELLLGVFYFLYGINYLLNLFKYRSHDKAYREIIFEREAYAMDKDPLYLKRRKSFAFLNYWSKQQQQTTARNY